MIVCITKRPVSRLWLGTLGLVLADYAAKQQPSNCEREEDVEDLSGYEHQDRLVPASFDHSPAKSEQKCHYTDEHVHR